MGSGLSCWDCQPAGASPNCIPCPGLHPSQPPRSIPDSDIKLEKDQRTPPPISGFPNIRKSSSPQSDARSNPKTAQEHSSFQNHRGKGPGFSPASRSGVSVAQFQAEAGPTVLGYHLSGPHPLPLRAPLLSWWCWWSEAQGRGRPPLSFQTQKPLEQNGGYHSDWSWALLAAKPSRSRPPGGQRCRRPR